MTDDSIYTCPYGYVGVSTFFTLVFSSFTSINYLLHCTCNYRIVLAYDTFKSKVEINYVLYTPQKWLGFEGLLRLLQP